MLNTSAATDARHSRSGKDAMLYNARWGSVCAGKQFSVENIF